MRQFTKIEAAKEEPKPLTVADMTSDDIFRIVRRGPWCVRCENSRQAAAELDRDIEGESNAK